MRAEWWLGDGRGTGSQNEAEGRPAELESREGSGALPGQALRSGLHFCLFHRTGFSAQKHLGRLCWDQASPHPLTPTHSVRLWERLLTAIRGVKGEMS